MVKTDGLFANRAHPSVAEHPVAGAAAAGRVLTGGGCGGSACHPYADWAAGSLDSHRLGDAQRFGALASVDHDGVIVADGSDVPAIVLKGAGRSGPVISPVF